MARKTPRKPRKPAPSVNAPIFWPHGSQVVWQLMARAGDFNRDRARHPGRSAASNREDGFFNCGRLFGRGPADDNGGVVGRGPADDNGGVVGRGPADDNGGVVGRGPADDNGRVMGRGPADDNGGLFGNRLPSSMNGRRVPTDIFMPFGRMATTSTFPDLDQVFRSFCGLGYVPDRPDARDESLDDLFRRTALDTPFLKALKGHGLKTASEIARKDFSPIDNQGPTQSCSAHAVTAMVEYHMPKSELQLSRLFLYKAARILGGIRGDQGATLRDTLKVLRRYGCLTEEEWPFHISYLELEPTLADIDAARRLRAFRYARLDDYNCDGEATLERVRRAIADDLPVVFGFMLYASAEKSSAQTGLISTPVCGERSTGGHAVLAVGYDDKKVLPGMTEPGCLLIRNSWGRQWGENGYGYLPYHYVRKQIACDFWVAYLPKTDARGDEVVS